MSDMEILITFLKIVGCGVWLFGTCAVAATGIQNQIHQWRTPGFNWLLIGVAFLSACCMFTALIVFLQNTP
jgi:hypothetical protein